MAYAAPASTSSRSAVVVSTVPESRARPVRSWVKPTPQRIHTAGARTRAYRIDLR
jgi:hypothetical protein